MRLLSIIAAALILSVAPSADAQVVRGWRENAAGGVTAGAAHDTFGPNGRTVGESGVVSNGDGAGVGGSRGCGRTYAGGEACRAGAFARGEDGELVHESGAVAQGAFGGTASTYGNFARDADGYLSGQRDSDFSIGDRDYSASTTFNSDDGFDHTVTCTQSSGGRC